MFKTITRKVHGGKELTVHLNTEEISIPVITEQVVEPKNLYDEDGNLVETVEPTEKLFKVVVVFKQNGYHVDYLVSEDTVKDLLKQAVERRKRQGTINKSSLYQKRQEGGFMKVRKVKGGYYIQTSVGGYPFSKTYRGYNRVGAIRSHTTMERKARKFGDKWIDEPEFNSFN